MLGAGAAGLLLVVLPAFPARQEVVLYAAHLLSGSGHDYREMQSSISPKVLYEPPVLRSKPKREPNVIFIVLESTRYDLSMGPDSRGEPLTPFLRSLAGRQARADSMYTAVSHTSKSLVGSLCGMYASPELETIESIRPSLPLTCLPHLLGSLGYRTAFFHTALGSFEDFPALARNFGFQHYQGREELIRPGFLPVGYFALDDYAMLDPAMDWIAAGDGPFFLTLLTSTTHHPYQLPGESRPKKPGLSDYTQVLARADGFLRDVFQRLEERGLLERSIVLVFGDHGEGFNEHRRSAHDWVPYEEGVRVPFLLVIPPTMGVPAPHEMEGVRSLLDVPPTVLDVLGVEWSGLLPGTSLLSDQNQRNGSVVSFCLDPDDCASLRWGKYQFVLHYEMNLLEAFDLTIDGGEQRNIISSIPEDQRQEALRQILETKRSVQAFWDAH